MYPVPAPPKPPVLCLVEEVIEVISFRITSLVTSAIFENAVCFLKSAMRPTSFCGAWTDGDERRDGCAVVVFPLVDKGPTSNSNACLRLPGAKKGPENDGPFLTAATTINEELRCNDWRLLEPR